MDQPWRVRTKLVQGPPGPTKLASGSADWTPGTIAGGASATTTVTVTGAVVGMTVPSPGFTNVLPAGVLAFGQVTAANTVTVTMTNFGSGPVTIPDGTIWVDVLVHP